MIDYLISSTICMALVLGLYQFLLSKEAMYQFNRFYLLLGLLASLIIPLITIDWGFGFLSNEVPVATARILEIPTIAPIVDVGIAAPITSYFDPILGFYLLIAMGFLMRFVYNLTRLYLKISRNKKIDLNSNYGILLPEDIVPYAFWNYIFVNEKEYTEGHIEPELLRHEVAHANERHSLDVIIVEVLQIVLWFNPMIYLFKRAIQLNHEFIADRYVVDHNYNIRSYQHLLLDKINQTSEMSLVSNLNFYFTKQRLEMMTKETSKIRSYSYTGLVAILFICLTFSFAKTEAQVSTDLQNEKSDQLKKDAYFKDATFKFRDKGDNVYISYDELSDQQQQLLPPPPPRPDCRDITSLEPGTVVEIRGRNIKLTKDGWVPPPPPPIAPPSPPAPPSNIVMDVPPPPSPPSPPGMDVPSAPSGIPGIGDIPAPPAPPVPPSPSEHINEMIEAGATFYMNGKKISSEEAQRLTSESDFKGSIRTKKVWGKYEVHLKK